MFLKKIWILIKIIVVFFLCAVLVANLYLIIAQTGGKNDLPKIFGYAQLIVVSGSMQPAIKPGDLIIIKEQRSYTENDIVTYRKGSTLITHRIIEANPSGIVTKGDANNVSDDSVSLSEIEGKVVLRIPGAGSVVLSIKKPTGILAVSCIVLLLFMISFACQRYKRPKKKV